MPTMAIGSSAGLAGARDGRDLDAADLLAQIAGDGGRGRVVEGEGGRQLHAGDLDQPVAQLDRHERVEAEVGEGQLGLDRVRRVMAEDRGDVRAHVGRARPRPTRPRAGRRGAWRATTRRALCRRAGTLTRPRSRPGSRPTRARAWCAVRSMCAVSSHGRSARRASSNSCRPASRRHRDEPEARPDLARAGVVEAGRHAALLRPQAPGHRRRGEAVATAALGQRVEVGVGRRVVALAGAAEQRAGGREQHELLERHRAREVVEVLGGVDLRPRARGRPGRAAASRSCRPRRCPRSGRRRSADVRRRSAASASRSVTSQAAISTSAPSASQLGRRRRRLAPRRETSSRLRTPWRSTRWRATSAPRPPVPPVTSTVPSPKDTSASPSPTRWSRGTWSRPSRKASCGSSAGTPAGSSAPGSASSSDEAPGVLGLRAAHEAPERRAGQVGALVLGHGDRAAGHEHDRRLVVAGDPLAEQLERGVDSRASRPALDDAASGARHDGSPPRRRPRSRSRPPRRAGARPGHRPWPAARRRPGAWTALAPRAPAGRGRRRRSARRRRRPAV